MYVNINSNKAEDFTDPLPFQRFTGMYHDLPSSNIASVTSANACAALCDADNTCEFWKFKTNRCELFASIGPELSGIKINKNMRDISTTSLVYSTNIPNSTPISSQNRDNLNACESACNVLSTCGAYSFNPMTTMCTLYGSGTPLTGNVGSSRSFSVIVKTLDSTRIKSSNGITFYDSNIYVSDTVDSSIKVFNVFSSSVTTLYSTVLNKPEGSFIIGPNMYIADTLNHRIRTLNILNNTLTSLAGSGTAGPAPASFSFPSGIAYGFGGNFLYVTDTGNHSIRRMDPTNGATTIFAGNGTQGAVNGSITSTGVTRFRFPTGIVSTSTNMYIADTGNHCIRRINGTSSTTLAGLVASTSQGYVDGLPGTARFDSPRCLALVGTNLYVSDGTGTQCRIRKINLIDRNIVTTLVGNVMSSTSTTRETETESTALFNNIKSMTADINKNILYVCDDNGLKSINLSGDGGRGFGGDFVNYDVYDGKGVRYVLHEFRMNGMFVSPYDKPLIVDIFIVGGGGGGGGGASGGGGGGGAGANVFSMSSISVPPGTTWAVNIGSGGTGGSVSGGAGSTGGNSSISTYVANGGGGGSGSGAAAGVGPRGPTGGGSYSTTAVIAPPSRSVTSLYTGGTAILKFASGGGGGAGGNGGNASQPSVGVYSPGNGGNGFTSDITGMNTIYGAGAPGVVSVGPNVSQTASGYGGGGGAGRNGNAGLKGNNGIALIRYRF